MHMLLVYRPEADDEEGNGRHGDSPFAGIELMGVAIERDEIERQAEERALEHPEWHFCLMPVS